MLGKSNKKNKDETLKNIDTLISDSVEISGDIKSEKTLRLDCHIKGDNWKRNRDRRNGENIW